MDKCRKKFENKNFGESQKPRLMRLTSETGLGGMDQPHWDLTWTWKGSKRESVRDWTWNEARQENSPPKFLQKFLEFSASSYFHTRRLSVKALFLKAKTFEKQTQFQHYSVKPLGKRERGEKGEEKSSQDKFKCQMSMLWNVGEIFMNFSAAAGGS
jgi:hypothetical protein